MGRHIVVALQYMAVMRRPFRRQYAKMSLEIAAHFRIRIFVDRQRCRSVLQEQMQQAHPAAGQLRQRAQHFVGNEMKAPAAGPQPDVALMPHDQATRLIGCPARQARILAAMASTSR